MSVVDLSNASMNYSGPSDSDLFSPIDPVGGTYRGVGSSWFNAENIAKEDFTRDQQAQALAFRRDLYQLGIQNAFNASEAQKSRDFSERMSNTAYQRAVADMKLAGLNPVLAYQQGGSSVPSSASASSSDSSRSSGYRNRGSSDPLSALLGVALQAVGLVVSHGSSAFASKVPVGFH